MSNDVVTFGAHCPQCRSDAVWTATRGGGLQEGHGRLRIDCGACGDSDPVAGLVEVIKRGVSA